MAAARTAADLITDLIAADAAQTLTYHGARGDRLTVIVDGRRRDYGTVDMQAWLGGFQLGRDSLDVAPRTDPTAATDPDLSRLRSVLVGVSLADQCRIAIRWAMEQRGITAVALANTVGHTPKTVTDALRYGSPTALSMPMAQDLMDGCGHTWQVRAAAPAAGEWQPIVGLAQAPPEPTGLTRIRAVMIAHERGLLHLFGPTSPVDAQRPNAQFTARRGDVSLRLPAATLLPWLTGLLDAVDPDGLPLLNADSKPRNRRQDVDKNAPGE